MMQSDQIFSPDFYVVGAPKAGTTALFAWLKDHPDVFLPEVKEPGYFAYAGKDAVPRSGPFDPDYVSRITVDHPSYAQLYADRGNRLCGDSSPVYLLDDQAAALIAAARPDARVIIVLRDPVRRAFSQFLHNLRDGLEPINEFEAALDAEDGRLRDGWSWGHGYATHGHYAIQIARYLAAFEREQILFLEYERLQSDPEECWHRMCGHLGIAQRPLFRNPRVNATVSLSGVPGRPGITRALKHPGPLQHLLKPLIPAGIRAKLRQALEGKRRAVPTLSEYTRANLVLRYANERKLIETQTGLELGHWAAGMK